MRHVRIPALVVSIVTIASPLAADAATLANINGNVLVDNGAGFKPASLTQSLPVGSRVTTQQGSSATISFDDFCTVTVLPGKIYVVPAQSPCAAGGNTVPSGLLPQDYAIVGGAAAGIGVGVYFATRSDSKPASP